MIGRQIILACFSLMLLALTGCGDPGTGPVEVKWDREACERCRMVLSDRFHSAQVRHSPAEERSKVYKFDDIGCAMIWLQEQPWKDDATTEIWVNDHRTGAWIDGRKANYIEGETTPMEYGLGAQLEAVADGLSFKQAKARVFEVEKRYNTHGAHLEQNQYTH